jgi:hypothetical protein
MKTLTLLLALACLPPAQAQDTRRPTEAMTVAAYEAEAIAKARQRPEVIKLRFALAKATTDSERKTISSALYAIIEAASYQGRLEGLAVIESRKMADSDLHQKWESERRHEELINALQNLRR